MKKLFLTAIILGAMLLVGCNKDSAPSVNVDTPPAEDTPKQENLTVYPLPSCYVKSEQASVTVDNKDVPVIKNQDQYDYCSFAFDEPITVTVTVKDNIKHWSVSPLAKGYTAEASGNTLTFTMNKPEYLIVKIDSLREIVLCADALEKDAPASSGEGIYNITAAPYNCVPDSDAVVTKAVQAAIDDAGEADGGTVYVPAGVFSVGCLNLHSNVSLYLEGGAVLRLTDDTSKLVSTWNKASINGYTTLPTGGKGPWKGVTMITCDADSENIRIYGRGTVDGRGVYMCNNKGFVVKIFYPKSVTNLTVNDVILRDSSSWNTVIYGCKNVNITNAKVFNEVHTMYEDDGIDIANSRNVLVKSCVIISEDDPASVKGMKDAPLLPCTDVVWEDIFVWTTTSAFKIGWKTYTDIKNVTFKNSYSYSCKNGIGIFHYDGVGEVENIVFENIDVENFLGKYKDGKREPTRAFLFEIRDRGEGVNTVKNVTISNVNFRNIASTSNQMSSLSSIYCFSDISFNNVVYCGKKLKTLPMIFSDTKYAKNITVQ